MAGPDLSQPPQLVDGPIEIRTTGAAQLLPQLLRIVQSLAQFGIQLAVIPAAISAAAVITPTLTTISRIRSIVRISLLALLGLLALLPTLPALLLS